jgi:hypothetical protein
MTTTRFLLASAAGLAAIASAQAADLPAKAKPVEYARACTLYGPAFYYIPGTDTCIRIGGHIRAEVSILGRGGGSSSLIVNGDGLATRTRDRPLKERRALPNKRGNDRVWRRGRHCRTHRVGARIQSPGTSVRSPPFETNSAPARREGWLRG